MFMDDSALSKDPQRHKNSSFISKTVDLLYLDDSGAGRPILSLRALADQGIPESAVKKLTGKSSQAMQFECGGGNVCTDTSLQITSPILGKTEAYVLNDSPIAMSMGQIVNEGRKPFVWMTGSTRGHAPSPRAHHHTNL